MKDPSEQRKAANTGARPVVHGSIFGTIASSGDYNGRKCLQCISIRGVEKQAGRCLPMIGKMLGHYQVLKKLGEGVMGVVYKAHDTHLDRDVAVKVLPAEKVSDPQRKARLVQEAKAASALNHPNIITIHDIASQASCDLMLVENFR